MLGKGTPIDSHTCRLVLRRVADEWAALPAAHQPPGVWISRHAPLPAACRALLTARGPAAPVPEAWFLDPRGLLPQRPSAWARLYAVHVVKPWSARHVWPDPALAGELPVGLAAFAEYAGSADLLVETRWWRNLAQGVRLAVDKGGALTVRQVEWIS